MSTIPRLSRKDRPLAIGNGSFWYRVLWKEDYPDAVGTLGYAAWIEANRMLTKKRSKK